MQSGYKEDLAYIHDAGFGHIAEHAARVALELLARSGIGSGTVVDLGCGSGITARLLRDAGFDVVGIDISEPLIERARKRVPDAEFRLGTFISADIPRCVAVTAIGEVFNYCFDSSNSVAARSDVFERIHSALIRGGVLVFDMAGPARAPSSGPRRNFSEGSDWAVLVEVDADDVERVLTRRITTFRKEGAHFRRDHEIHRLQLVEPVEIREQLRKIGFVVEDSNCYGSLTLPTGLVAFLARKPGG